MAESDEPEVVQVEAVAVEQDEHPAVVVEQVWSQVARDALEAGPVDRDESQVALVEQVVSVDGC